MWLSASGPIFQPRLRRNSIGPPGAFIVLNSSWQRSQSGEMTTRIRFENLASLAGADGDASDLDADEAELRDEPTRSAAERPTDAGISSTNAKQERNTFIVAADSGRASVTVSWCSFDPSCEHP